MPTPATRSPNEDIVKGYKVDTDTFIEVTKEELENVALESTRTIEIDEFVDKTEIDPRYLIRPYYLRPDGKVGHDAFAVIRETIREMDKVAIGRVVLTNREHIIALEPLDKGLIGTLLRYPYEVRDPTEYFDEIQDVKVTKDMLDLARHIVEQKAGSFEPDKFEDQYETALVDLINQKRAGKPITPKERPARRERRRPDGRAAQERRRRRGRDQGSEEAGQEGQEGGGRPEGNADADRRQEAGEGGGREEAGGGSAAEVGVKYPGDPGRTLLRRPRPALADGQSRTSDEAERSKLTKRLMAARRAVRDAKAQAIRRPRRRPIVPWTMPRERSASEAPSGGTMVLPTSTGTWRRTRSTPTGMRR